MLDLRYMPRSRFSIRTANRTAVSYFALTIGLVVAGEHSDALAQSNQQATEEIVVTGSRVTRDGFEAPTPVTVLNTDEMLRDAPIALSDLINKLPVFSSSPTARNSVSSVSDGNAGVSNLNLRSIGANRTLVLFDGARLAGSSIGGFHNNGGSVDISVFPDGLISRVDVVTGGASAPYGSDAVAGVVNFILDKNFTGVKGSLTGGVTTYGDDRQYLATLTAGTSFANGRGHIIVSGSNSYNAGIPNAGEAREWAYKSWGQVINPAYTPTNGLPYYLRRANTGSITSAPGGIITTAGPLKGITFGPGGTIHRFVYGDPTDSSLTVGGDWELTAAGGGAVPRNSSLDPKVVRNNAFVRTSYDITDDFQLYLQYLYSITKTTTFSGSPNRNNLTIRSDNPFIPDGVRTVMQANNIASFSMGARFEDLPKGGVFNTRQYRDYTVGGNGTVEALQTAWSWNFYVKRSVSEASINVKNAVIINNLLAAVDVITSPTTGLPVCRSYLANPSCVPYNVMGLGVNNPAAANYFLGTPHLNQDVQQDAQAFGVSGEPFDLWAGPVSLAFGVEHRKESVDGQTTALDAASAFSTGNYKVTTGAYTVTDGYVETVVPLARDEPWAKSLDVNAAARVTNYSTSGTVFTYKVGASYDVNGDIRFRATRSRDIRSPNLGEYFSAGQPGSLSIRDPYHNNQSLSIVWFNDGNTNLKPEKADTTGFGVVYRPSFIPGLSMSLDYYDINLSGTILRVQQQVIADGCYAGNQLYCSQIEFDADGYIRIIRLQNQNSAAQKTNGLDFEASYSLPMSEIVGSWDGTATIRGLLTHTRDLTTITPDGQVIQGLNVYGGGVYPYVVAPKWRYNVMVSYDTESFSGSLTARGIGSGVVSSNYTQCTSGCPTLTSPQFSVDDNHLPGALYLDLNLTYRWAAESGYSAEIFFTGENLTNWEQDFPIISFTPGQYDLLGRTFRAGLRFKI